MYTIKMMFVGSSRLHTFTFSNVWVHAAVYQALRSRQDIVILEA